MRRPSVSSRRGGSDRAQRTTTMVLRPYASFHSHSPWVGFCATRCMMSSVPDAMGAAIFLPVSSSEARGTIGARAVASKPDVLGACHRCALFLSVSLIATVSAPSSPQKRGL